MSKVALLSRSAYFSYRFFEDKIDSSRADARFLLSHTLNIILKNIQFFSSHFILDDNR